MEIPSIEECCINQIQTRSMVELRKHPETGGRQAKILQQAETSPNSIKRVQVAISCDSVGQYQNQVNKD